MNSQTKIIVATAVALAAIDIAVRAFLPTRTVVIREQVRTATVADSDVLTVRELRVVDDNGTVKAHLKVDRNGEPGLLMFDRTGAERLQLDTFQSVPSLILLDGGERRRVYFGMDMGNGNGQYENYSAENAPAHYTGD